MYCSYQCVQYKACTDDGDEAVHSSKTDVSSIEHCSASEIFSTLFDPLSLVYFLKVLLHPIHSAC